MMYKRSDCSNEDKEMERMKKILFGIFIGAALTFTTTAFADSIEKFILTKVSYPIVVKGTEYKNADLPVLNYDGNTYVPLKAVGDTLGVKVDWNSDKGQVEIGMDSKASGDLQIIEGYHTNKRMQVIKYNGTIYLTIAEGSAYYNLIPKYNPDLKSLQFEMSDSVIKLSDGLDDNADSFTYQGRYYISESIFIQVSKEVQIQLDEINQEVDASYSKFKELFTIEHKTLTSDNSVYMHANHNGSDEQELKVFFDYWNQLGNLKSRLLERYAIEFQKLNPDYPLDIRFNYYGVVNHFLANIMVDKDGKIKQTNINEIKNPNPDQSSIK